MKGLKRHTKDERRKIAREMIPLIKNKFGDNLIGLAYVGSMARDDDADHSDIELVAYLKEMPTKKGLNAMSKIRDGVLVELEWTTKEDEIKNTHEVTRDWYIAGSDFQKAIINDELITEINDFVPENLEQRCRDRAAVRWYEVQEATGKLFNALDQNNIEGIPLLFFELCLQMLIVLSFINLTPYTTMSKFVTQAKSFAVKPDSFDDLMDILIKGKYTDLENLRAIVERVFEEFEELFSRMGYELYYNDLDPNLPHKDYLESLFRD